MIKVLSYWFHKCFGPFHMLTLKGSSETAIVRECSNQALDILSFRKYISSEDLLLFEDV